MIFTQEELEHAKGKAISVTLAGNKRILGRLESWDVGNGSLTLSGEPDDRAPSGTDVRRLGPGEVEQIPFSKILKAAL
jgi:hypothetical protein